MQSKEVSRHNSSRISYDYKQSPLFRLSSKKKLAELLRCSTTDLKKLQSKDLYKVFNTVPKSGKSREIQEPHGLRKKAHARIAILLSKISIADYLHSGRKGYSHITNASKHIECGKQLSTDIVGFFNSTKYDKVFQFFCFYFEMSQDVAHILSRICCYNNHLPTGSRVSMPLAYFSNIRMFDELFRLSCRHNVVMTVYVDDLTFSGESINKLFLNTVKKIVVKHGHKLHPRKTRLFSKNEPRVVTGVVIAEDGFRLKNSQHRNIYEEYSAWTLVRDYAVSLDLEKKLVGRLYAASQVVPNFKEKAYAVLNYKPTS